MISIHGKWLVFLLRTSSVMPAEIFNYAASLTELTLLDYGFGCIGSIVPVALWVFVTATAQTAASAAHRTHTAKGIEGEGKLVFIIVNVIFVIIVTGGIAV